MYKYGDMYIDIYLLNQTILKSIYVTSSSPSSATGYHMMLGTAFYLFSLLCKLKKVD